MLKILKSFSFDERGDTASVTYAFSPNTLAQSAHVNQNFQDLIAVINDLSSVNYRNDSVTAAKLNGDVVRSNFGLLQHTDGSLYVSVDNATIKVGASGLYIGLTNEAQGDIMYRNNTGWVRLAAGTAAQFLRTAGASANPSWANIGDPKFSVHKNGTNQTGIANNTATDLTWSTESYDSDSDFASNLFTPQVAGKYLLILKVQWNGAVDQTAMFAYLTKNGTGAAGHIAEDVIAASGTGAHSQTVIAIVEANGSSDYFGAVVKQTSGSDKAIDGDAVKTYFQGFFIGG